MQNNIKTKVQCWEAILRLKSNASLQPNGRV